MHTHVMSDADQEKADMIKNAILDLCLQQKVNALVAISATRCASECFEEIIREQGGEVFTVATPPPSVREAARAAAKDIREWIGISGMVDGEGLNEVAAIIERHCSPVSAASGDECAWTLDDSNDGDVWGTGCGETFQFTDGENHFTYCYKCGKRIDAARYSDFTSVGEEGK